MKTLETMKKESAEKYLNDVIGEIDTDEQKNDATKDFNSGFDAAIKVMSEVKIEWAKCFWIDETDNDKDNDEPAIALYEHPKQGPLLWQSQLIKVFEALPVAAQILQLKSGNEVAKETIKLLAKERDDLLCKNMQIEAENLRLRDALQFYADGRVDHEPDIPIITGWNVTRYRVSEFYGSVARKALSDKGEW